MPRVKKEAETQPNHEPLMPDSVVNRASKGSGFKYIPWLLIVIVVLLAGSFLYHQNRKAESLEQELTELKNNPATIAEKETKELLEKVSQLIELPQEQPTIATVTDLKPLQDQPFFANAQVDDRVLIFTGAQKAYLYRPSTNKIIEVAPVNLDSSSKTSNSNRTANNSNRSTSNDNAGSSQNTNISNKPESEE